MVKVTSKGASGCSGVAGLVDLFWGLTRRYDGGGGIAYEYALSEPAPLALNSASGGSNTNWREPGALSVLLLLLNLVDRSMVGELDLDPSPDKALTTGDLSRGGEPSDPCESDSGPSEELPWPESDFELLPLRNFGI